jgi:protein subunit release factor B
MNDRLHQLGVRAADLDERFVRAGGHGGQNVNKVATCVILTHLPTGLSVRVETERTQARNREIARDRLADRLEARARERKAAARDAAERARRRKRRPSAAARRRNVEEKRRRGTLKSSRRYRPDSE